MNKTLKLKNERLIVPLNILRGLRENTNVLGFFGLQLPELSITAAKRQEFGMPAPLNDPT